MPMTPRNGAGATARSSSRQASPSSRQTNSSPSPKVTPQSARRRPRRCATTSVWPARAPRTSIGPVERVTACSSASRSKSSASGSHRQPAFSDWKRMESPGSTVSTGSSSREKKPWTVASSAGLVRGHARGSWIHASVGASSTRRPMRCPSSSRNSQSESACSSPRTLGRDVGRARSPPARAALRPRPRPRSGRARSRARARARAACPARTRRPATRRAGTTRRRASRRAAARRPSARRRPSPRRAASSRTRRARATSGAAQNSRSFRAASTTRSTDGMYASSIFQYGYGTS